MNVNLPNSCFEAVYVSSPKTSQNSQSIHYYFPGRNISLMLRRMNHNTTIHAHFAESNPASDPNLYSVSFTFFPLELIDKIHLTMLDKMQLGHCSHEKIDDQFIIQFRALEFAEKNHALELEMLAIRIASITMAESGINQYGSFLVPNKSSEE